MNIPQVKVERVDNRPPTPKTIAKRNDVRWNNQKVIRSDARNEGYVYLDWRNW